MATVIRFSGWLVMIVLVVATAAAEVTWMAERVITHRAARAKAHVPYTPGKVINLPLTGFK